MEKRRKTMNSKQTKHTLTVESRIDVNKHSDIKTIIDKISTELKFINAVEIEDRPEPFTLTSIYVTKDGERLKMETIFEVKD